MGTASPPSGSSSQSPVDRRRYWHDLASSRESASPRTPSPRPAALPPTSGQAYPPERTSIDDTLSAIRERLARALHWPTLLLAPTPSDPLHSSTPGKGSVSTSPVKWEEFERLEVAAERVFHVVERRGTATPQTAPPGEPADVEGMTRRVLARPARRVYVRKYMLAPAFTEHNPLGGEATRQQVDGQGDLRTSGASRTPHRPHQPDWGKPGHTPPLAIRPLRGVGLQEQKRRRRDLTLYRVMNADSVIPEANGEMQWGEGGQSLVEGSGDGRDESILPFGSPRMGQQGDRGAWGSHQHSTSESTVSVQLAGSSPLIHGCSRQSNASDILPASPLIRRASSSIIEDVPLSSPITHRASSSIVDDAPLSPAATQYRGDMGSASNYQARARQQRGLAVSVGGIESMGRPTIGSRLGIQVPLRGPRPGSVEEGSVEAVGGSGERFATISMSRGSCNTPGQPELR